MSERRSSAVSGRIVHPPEHYVAPLPASLTRSSKIWTSRRSNANERTKACMFRLASSEQNSDSQTWTASIDAMRNYRGRDEWHLSAIEFHHKDRKEAEKLRDEWLAARCSAVSAEEKMPVARPVAFRVPRVVNDQLSKTEFRLFDDEDEARRAACDIGADYDGLFLVADRRAAFFAQPRPSAEPQTARDPMMAAVASLAAAISLLERTPKANKAAPSDKMFNQTLDDYRRALANARDALRSQAVSAPSDLADAINAGIKACDLYEVAKEDVLRRSHLEQFLTAAMAALTRPQRGDPSGG